MPKDGKVELLGLKIAGVSTVAKFGQDAKVEIETTFKIVGRSLGPRELMALHELEGEPVNLTIARQQTKLDEK